MNDCERCEPTDDTEPYPYDHCCGCGADGSSEFPDCTCAPSASGGDTE
ncbi:MULTISPECIES: hypothetical protein [Streptomyces]|nr:MULTISPECIES: hypothetical protein [Streptomyces]MYS67586.1 hypothetical protein [Streptomyces sp. SID5473]